MNAGKVQPPRRSANTEEEGMRRRNLLLTGASGQPLLPNPTTGHVAPAYWTARSLPSQYGARSSRLRTFMAPDRGRGSERNSTDLGTL